MSKEPKEGEAQRWASGRAEVYDFDHKKWVSDDGGRGDWYCHYCGYEKKRGTMCGCREARLHVRVERIELLLGRKP